MQALETIASISNHRLIIESDALPLYSERARVIVLWDAPSSSRPRTPPSALAGLGQEKGDILSSIPESDWGVLS